MKKRSTELVAYLVPKQLPVILAKALKYRAPPCLAVFQDKTTKKVEIVEVPL